MEDRDKDTLLANCLSLCKQYQLLPHNNGSSIDLPHVLCDRVIHDINVCFHELGHLFALDQNEFDTVLKLGKAPEGYINNLDYYIRTYFDYRLEHYNELCARAIQIGLNIVFDLWPSYDELTGLEYSEYEVRKCVAAPATAQAVIKIVEVLSRVNDA